MTKQLLRLSVFILLMLGSLGVFSPALARGEFAISPFGGELRGMTRLIGQILCADCSLEKLQEDPSTPKPDQLYEFRNGNQKAVFRVVAVGDLAHTGNEDASQAGHWQAIAGLGKRLAVRTDNALWQMLVAQDNRERPVELNCWLRSTRTLDIAELTFHE
jgi:hypothetical protein